MNKRTMISRDELILILKHTEVGREVWTELMKPLKQKNSKLMRRIKRLENDD